MIHRIAPALRRVMWALLAAMHIPLLLSALTNWAAEGFGAVRLGSCVALALTLVFFGLKVYGPRWLAFGTDLRSFAAAGVIVAFIHFGALHRDSPAPYLTEASTAVVTLGLVLTGLVLRKVARRSARLVEEIKIRRSVTRSRDTLWLDVSRPHCWTLTLRIFCAHAPPA